MKKTLSVIALLLSLVTVLSFGSISAYAESSDVSAESSEVSIESSEASEESSVESAESSEASAESSEASAESSEASAESSEASAEESSKEDDKATAADPDDGDFPWALVIFLGLVVVLVIVCIVCIKLDNRFGRWLKDFFRDYKSEIKKITWPSREVTIKSTIVVLVCVLVCATVIGLLDFGLGKLVELLMDLVSGK
ncbi:MAG: preprotein translocase subunit SecE [Clostridia bacterium]|nr:preprotein translocase subunit SecE [Clostridia bacterium]